MDRDVTLGPLAHAVIEQFGDLADTAVGRAVARRKAALNGTRQPDRVLGHVFSDRELADERLRPGNWVTVGAVTGDGSSTLIEINLGTWEAREISASASSMQAM